MHLYVLVAGLVAAPLSARAADDGMQVGLRGAFSLPVGSIQSGASFSEGLTGFVPIAAEVGYRFNSNFYAGVAGEYGFGIPKNCPTGGDCSAHTIVVGLDARYRYFPDSASIAPWIGFSVGYERLSVSASSGTTMASATASGLQFAGLALGVDFFGTPKIAVGPFVSASLGEYLSADLTQGGTTRSLNFDKALHGFFQFGLRISFLP